MLLESTRFSDYLEVGPGSLVFQEPEMSSDPAADRQRKVSEFLQLLPLTLAIAGLPESELGRNFNEGQMEVRVNTVRNAYKLARQLVLDITK